LHPKIKDEINELIKQIHAILQSKGLSENLSEYSSEYPALNKLIEDLLALRNFTDALSKGDLSQTLSLRGYWPGLLKALQSNLRHLTLQTRMVASGDYNQHIDFMGDFSHAFNTMITRLKESTENEQKYIDELKSYQIAIEESERKYKFISENIDDVIWLLDDAMNIRYISPSLEKLLGFTAAEVEQKPINETALLFLQAAFREVTNLPIENRGTQLPLIIEWEQIRKDRKMVWLESSVNVAQNFDGDFIGFIGITRNISERKKDMSLLHHSYERKKRNTFFNRLASQNDADYSEICVSGWQDNIYIPKDFSLFFLALSNLNPVSNSADKAYRQQQLIDALLDHLNQKKGTIAWETASGIGIISAAPQCAALKDKEIEAAKDFIKYISAYISDFEVRIGTANYSEGWTKFANRLKNAETSVRIGKQVWPNQKTYHYEDCGIYQVLAPFAATDEAVSFITQMIGPLIKHPDLVETLEKILSGLSFKEIGAQMYLHHKTIQLRKQRIEQLLNISLDSYETRMSLVAAIQLMKIANGI